MPVWTPVGLSPAGTVDNTFPGQHSEPPWPSYSREAADGTGTLQLSASHVFVPTRSSLDVAGPGEKDVVAMLVGLEVGVSGRPAVGTRTTVQGRCPGCILEFLGSSSCKTHLAPSQGEDATPLGVRHWERSPMVPIFRLDPAAHLVSTVDLEPLCLRFCHMSLSLQQLGSCSKVMLIY